MPEKKAGMVEHSRRGNGLCKVSFCPCSKRKRVGKQLQGEVLSPGEKEEAQGKDAFPLRQCR